MEDFWYCLSVEYSLPGSFCIILLIDMLIKGTFVLSFCDAMVDVVEETLLESGD